MREKNRSKKDPLNVKTDSDGNYRSELHIYRGMKGRCNNPNNTKFHVYGGRGISVCERWMEDFENFWKDMGPRPSKEHSIDRIDVNGNYEPENCRWATRKEQDSNTRRNVKIKAYGVELTISEWARTLEISKQRICYRRKTGWSDFDALFTPSKTKKGLN